jgi:hypothetical protein
VEELVEGSLGRISRVLQGPQTRELKQLRAQLAQLEATLNRVLEEQEEGRRPATGAGGTSRGTRDAVTNPTDNGDGS